MSDEKKDMQFWESADAHISLANEQSDRLGLDKANAVMMYSAARYNAFIASTKTESDEELEALKASCIEYYVEEYKKMFTENLEDWIRNFEKYNK